MSRLDTGQRLLATAGQCGANLRWNVFLGVPGGEEQERGDDERLQIGMQQPIERSINVRLLNFQESGGKRQRGDALSDCFSQRQKLSRADGVSRSVADK